MKRLAFLALLLATACGTGVDYERAPTGNGDGNLFATVDGASYSGSLNVQAIRTGNKIVITGFASNNRRLVLTLGSASAPGTFQLTVGGANIGDFYEAEKKWSSAVTGGSGTITFSVLTSRRGTGTFTFTAPAETATGATGTRVILAGTFDVLYAD